MWYAPQKAIQLIPLCALARDILSWLFYVLYITVPDSKRYKLVSKQIIKISIIINYPMAIKCSNLTDRFHVLYDAELI